MEFEQAIILSLSEPLRYDDLVEALNGVSKALQWGMLE